MSTSFMVNTFQFIHSNMDYNPVSIDYLEGSLYNKGTTNRQINMIEQIVSTQLPRLSPQALNEAEQWLLSRSVKYTFPIYSSFDVRISHYKASVIDANLFPAGFNNLCHNMLQNASQVFQRYVDHYYPGTQIIGIFTEGHTRNQFYFKHLQALRQLVQEAGYDARMIHPEFEGTLSGLTFSRNYLQEADIVLLNNDSSNQFSFLIDSLNIPVVPARHLGWFNRRKSHHYRLIHQLSEELCQQIDVDPWRISAYYDVCSDADLSQADTISMLQDKASQLLQHIRTKYKQYVINQKPQLFIKDDSGTYGMGIMTIQEPSELNQLNRKLLNKMKSGKQHIIKNLVLQESIPTNLTYDNASAEPVIYCIGATVIGSFLRVNSQRGNTSNLNSKGMEFYRVCTEPDKHPHLPSECVGEHIINPLALLSVQIALLAAAIENTYEHPIHY